MASTSTTPEIGRLRSVPTPGEIDLLLEHLTDFDENKRLSAAHRLGQLHDQRAVQTLIGRLYIDGSPTVRQAAVESLYAINDASAWPEIAKVLKQDDTPTVRGKAAEILGLSGDKTQSASLLVALQDATAEVRRQAAIGIGKLQDTSILAGLIAGLTQVDGKVKQFESDYIDALVALGGWEVADTVLKSAETCNDASGGYRPDDKNCTYELQKVTSDRYSSSELTLFYESRIKVLKRIQKLRMDHTTAKAPVLVIAIRAMEEFQDQASIPMLCQIALTYREPAIRWLALQALYLRKALDSGDSLGKVLRDDKDWIVRKKASEVLGNLRIQTADELLYEKALDDSETQVRRQAIRAIGQLALMSSLPTLREIIQTSPDEEARVLACEALVQLKSKEVIRPLASALGTDRSSRVRQKAAEALGIVGERDALLFLTQVMQKQTESAEVRMAAAAATAKLGNDKAVDELWNMLRASEFSLQITIVRHLISIKTEMSTAHIVKMLGEITAIATYNYASGSYRDVNLHHLAVDELANRPTVFAKACLGEIVYAKPRAFDEYITKTAVEALLKIDQKQAFQAFRKAIEAKVNLQYVIDGLSRLESEEVKNELYTVWAEVILIEDLNNNLVEKAISELIKTTPANKAVKNLGKALESKVNVKQAVNGLACLASDLAGEKLLDFMLTSKDDYIVRACIDALAAMRYRASYREIQKVAGMPEKYQHSEVQRTARSALERLKKAGETLPFRGFFDFEPYWTP